MAKPTVRNVEIEKAGLCADCSHARSLQSDRGSTFLLCGLSSSDPGYPKYPQLPVLSCAGYLKKDAPAPPRGKPETGTSHS